MEAMLNGDHDSDLNKTLDSSDIQEEVLRARREAANQHSEPLRIPPECRNKIILGVIEDGIWRRPLPIASYGLSAKDIFFNHVRGLAQACRTLRTETMYLFWGSNQFRFDLRDHELFCECLEFIALVSTEILSSLRKIEFVPTYWQPLHTTPLGYIFVIDREREQLRLVDDKRAVSRYHEPFRTAYLKQAVRQINAISPHKNDEPLGKRQLGQLLKLMSPKTFLQIAKAKAVLR